MVQTHTVKFRKAARTKKKGKRVTGKLFVSLHKHPDSCFTDVTHIRQLNTQAINEDETLELDYATYTWHGEGGEGDKM